jgi:hypothetical protein
MTDKEVLTAEFERFESYRVPHEGSPSLKREDSLTPKMKVTNSWLMIHSLGIQADRLVGIALDAPGDIEREGEALKCEAKAASLENFYVKFEPIACATGFANTRELRDVLAQILKRIDDLAAEVRQLAESYDYRAPA